MLERLYFLIRGFSQNEWIVIQTEMLSITGLSLENFTDLIRNLRFDIKYEKVEKGDEVITFEKGDEYYKVMFKKQLINKRANRIEFNDKLKERRHYKKKNRTKSKMPKSDSPFSSLKVLLEN